MVLMELTATPDRECPSALRTRVAGVRILLRPISASDKGRLRLGMARLSAVSRRHRFFSARAELDDDMVAYLTEVDHRSHFAWAAVAVDLPGQPIIAVARYIVADQPATAEFALAVGDEFQGQGLGTLMFRLLAIVARANGIEHFSASVLADNVPMRRLMAAAGAKFEVEEVGVLRATMDLPSADSIDPGPVVAIAMAAAAQAAA
jgi:RimJ/RimL family protein N-acetyltransferase